MKREIYNLLSNFLNFSMEEMLRGIKKSAKWKFRGWTLEAHQSAPSSTQSPWPEDST